MSISSGTPLCLLECKTGQQLFYTEKDFRGQQGRRFARGASRLCIGRNPPMHASLPTNGLARFQPMGSRVSRVFGVEDASTVGRGFQPRRIPPPAAQPESAPDRIPPPISPRSLRDFSTPKPSKPPICDTHVIRKIEDPLSQCLPCPAERFSVLSVVPKSARRRFGGGKAARKQNDSNGQPFHVTRLLAGPNLRNTRSPPRRRRQGRDKRRRRIRRVASAGR